MSQNNVKGALRNETPEIHYCVHRVRHCSVRKEYTPSHTTSLRYILIQCSLHNPKQLKSWCVQSLKSFGLLDFKQKAV